MRRFDWSSTDRLVRGIAMILIWYLFGICICERFWYTARKLHSALAERKRRALSLPGRYQRPVFRSVQTLPQLVGAAVLSARPRDPTLCRSRPFGLGDPPRDRPA